MARKERVFSGHFLLIVKTGTEPELSVMVSSLVGPLNTEVVNPFDIRGPLVQQLGFDGIGLPVDRICCSLNVSDDDYRVSRLKFCCPEDTHLVEDRDKL